jgi:carboxymethylenebutenolidase
MSTASNITFAGNHGELHAVYAAPDSPRGAVLIVHENRGLTPHFVDLVGRFSNEGYAALCVDLASVEGGSEQLGDEEAAREVLGRTPRERLLDDLRSSLDELARRAPGHKLGIVGFCFGGALTWQLLERGESRISAAVAFYGPTAEGADFSGAQAAVLGIYGGLDEKVNATRPYAEAALQAAGLTHRLLTFDGADHAFFNDTRPNHNAQASAKAQAALLAWLSEHLG